MSEIQYNIGSGSAETLKSFLLTPDTKSKSDPAYGLAVSKSVSGTIFGATNNGYFWNRNARFKVNRDMAAGRMNITKFMDRLELNGKFNYSNINWQSLKIVNTIISKMVGRWMARNEKMVGTAIDPLSQQDKMDEYRQAEFIFNHRKELEALQQQSGVQMIPQNQFVPTSQEDLLLWKSEYLRLPEEILYELGVNNIFDACGFYGANKEKLCHDSAEVGFVGIYVGMDESGVIRPEWVKPENAFYSYTEYNDLRDTTIRGRVVGMKISEIRRKYGVEFGGEVSEEQLFKFAQFAKDYQIPDKLTWNTIWTSSILRPYDEWNLDVTEFEIKTVDSDPYTLTKTGMGSTFIERGLPKNGNGNVKSKLKDTQEYIEDTHINIYRGVYIRELEHLLEWGIKKNMIRPDDPKESGNAEFSYSYYMYQNQDMRNIAVPEKIQRPAEGMILACYKIEQLVAKMRPPGAAINETALQEIDYGLGDKNKDVDYKAMYDQTGNIYYRGLDGDGRPIPVPITELTNSGFQPQMMALIEDYRFHYQVLKDELGEDPNLATQAAQPRVTEGNIQTSLQQIEYATDYMYRAVLYVMEDAAKKIGCLLKMSIEYGAEVYRDIMQEEHIKGRRFSMKIKALPTDIDIARLDAFMNQALQSNPLLIQFLDPFLTTRIAREDVKLAELYVRNCQKKMIAFIQQQEQQKNEILAKNQQDSLKMNQEGAESLEQMKAKNKTMETTELSRSKKEEILLTTFGNMWAAGTPIPPYLKGVEAEIIKNVALPVFAENQVNMSAIQQAQQLHAQADQQEQEQGQPQQQQLPPPDQNQIQQPQPQAA